jgi:GDPmannose 4,6-dehydratase
LFFLLQVGTDQDGKVVVRIDPKYFRPTEVDLLWGDCSKAQKELGWKRKVTFDELVKEMVEADIAACSDKHLKW